MSCLLAMVSVYPRAEPYFQATSVSNTSVYGKSGIDGELPIPKLLCTGSVARSIMYPLRSRILLEK